MEADGQAADLRKVEDSWKPGTKCLL